VAGLSPGPRLLRWAANLASLYFTVAVLGALFDYLDLLGRERALSERLLNIGATSQQRIAWSSHQVLDQVLAIGKGQS
jgi:hypothetical protein